MPYRRFAYNAEELARMSLIGQVFLGYIERLAWDAAQAWNSANVEMLNAFRGNQPRGGRWLVKACEHIEALGIEGIVEKDHFDAPMRALKMLVGIRALEDGEDVDTLAGQLKRFNEKTLLAVLPLAQAGGEAVWRALGWDDVTPVWEWIRWFSALYAQRAANDLSDEPRYAEAPEVS